MTSSSSHGGGGGRPAPSAWGGAPRASSDGEDADRGWDRYLEELDAAEEVRRLAVEALERLEQLEWDYDDMAEYRNYTTGPGVLTIDVDPRYL